jgi:hypothetical protein
MKYPHQKEAIMVLRKNHRIIALLLIILFLCFALARAIEARRLERLRVTLFKENKEIDYSLGVQEDDPRLNAIEQLQKMRSPRAVSLLRDFLTNNYMNQKLKQKALTALGRLATRHAINAITEFESWSKKRFNHPLAFKFGKHPSPIDHFADGYMKPLAQTTDKHGKTWAIFSWARYSGWSDDGRQEIWLTSRKQNSHWAEPILLDLQNIPVTQGSGLESLTNQCPLAVESGIVRITLGGQKFEACIKDSFRDSDGDTLPDIVEARLPTDQNDPDCDNDGIPDGNDSNPLTPPTKEPNDTHEIRQAVFSILLATSSNRQLIFIIDKGDQARQEYYGSAGPVFPAKETEPGAINITTIDVKITSPTRASAYVADWEGNLAASGHEAKLRKIRGKWVVVQFAMTWIS